MCTQKPSMHIAHSKRHNHCTYIDTVTFLLVLDILAVPLLDSMFDLLVLDSIFRQLLPPEVPPTQNWMHFLDTLWSPSLSTLAPTMNN